MLQTLPSSGLLWMVQNNGLVQCLPVWLLIYWFLFGLNWQHALITHARTDYAYSQHVKQAWSRRSVGRGVRIVHLGVWAWEWPVRHENHAGGVRLGRSEIEVTKKKNNSDTKHQKTSWKEPHHKRNNTQRMLQESCFQVFPLFSFWMLTAPKLDDGIEAKWSIIQ